MAYIFSVLYSSDLRVRTATSTTLHAASTATFVLSLAGTSTPATIYADDSFAVSRTDGKVVTDPNGNWSAYLDPTYDYQIKYLGVTYPKFSPGVDEREGAAKLAEHAALTSGVHGATAGDPLASQGWVNTQIANTSAPGTATPDATSSVKGKIKLTGVLSGTADSPALTTLLQNQIDHAIQDSEKGANSGVATLDSGGKVPTSQLPSTGTTPDATTSAKGIMQMAGDLGGTGGTAAAPKIADALRTQITGSVQATTKGAAGGVASLDGSGKVPSAQLPAGGFSGDFAGAAAVNYLDNWLAVSTTTRTVAANESGSIASATNSSGCVFSFPKTLPKGFVFGVQQGNATGRSTVQCQDTTNGSYMVNADSQFKTAKQNAIIWVRCVTNGAGNNAGFVVDGYTGA